MKTENGNDQSSMEIDNPTQDDAAALLEKKAKAKALARQYHNLWDKIKGDRTRDARAYIRNVLEATQ